MNDNTLIPLGRALNQLGLKAAMDGDGERREYVLATLGMPIVDTRSVGRMTYHYVAESAFEQAKAMIDAGAVKFNFRRMPRKAPPQPDAAEKLLAQAAQRRAIAMNYDALLAKAPTDAVRYRLRAKASKQRQIASALERRAQTFFGATK